LATASPEQAEAERTDRRHAEVLDGYQRRKSATAGMVRRW
jgi:hypothetical protein